MNPLIQFTQSLNQIKFTDIIILLLLVYAIIDFHFHIKKSQNREEKKISVSWDYKLQKPILSIKVDPNSYITIALSEADANSLLNDLNKLKMEGQGKYLKQINALSKAKVPVKNQLTEKDKVVIPAKLLKKYEKDEAKLSQIKPLLKPLLKQETSNDKKKKPNYELRPKS